MSEVNFKYNHGDVLKDKVTGFKGVVMVRAEYSTGCHHYGLCPKEFKDGKEPDWVWLDQSRLELVKKGKVTFKVDRNNPGGPVPRGPQ